MRKRILAGMGANSFGMAITVGIQLASLPIFLHVWSTANYGVWLVLSAVPAYLSMADVGMVTAAGNKMTMAMSKNDVAEANRVFQSAQLFMAVVCGAIALVALPIILFAPLPWLQNFNQRMALAALCAGVLVGLFGGLTEAVFKSTQRYALGTMLGNCARLGEWLGAMLGLIAVGSFAAVALGGLIARIVFTFAAIGISQRGEHGIQWGTKHADMAEIKCMVKPALSFMAFPLANALSFQGVTLLVAALFGPVSVALFNTYRTVARVAVQITAIFSHALWPEFSRLYGEGNIANLKRIYKRTAYLSALQAFALSVVMYFLTPWLLGFWTHHQIEFVPSLMLFMLLYAFVAGVWHVPRVMLMSTNQHVGLVFWTLAAGVLSVGLAWALHNALRLNGVALAMLFSELLIAIACVNLVHEALADKPELKAILQ